MYVRDTSHLMQRINDTWASISQNVEAVVQRRKRLCACMKENEMEKAVTCKGKAKGHHFEHLLN